MAGIVNEVSRKAPYGQRLTEKNQTERTEFIGRNILSKNILLYRRPALRNKTMI